MTFKDFSFPNGTLYQSGNKSDIFRNQLIVLDENVDEEDLFYETLNTQLSNIRRAQLFKIWRSLLYVQFSFTDAIYYPRWSFFFIGYTKPPYNPPSEIFNIKNVPWVNFGEGFYYVNYSDKSVALWTTYDPETRTMEEIGNKTLNIVNATFPVQDSIYLEGNYYLKKYLEFCEACIKNLAYKSDGDLSGYVEELNNKISECINRSTQYHTDFGYLCYNIDPLFFANNVNAYGIFKPMIDELTESATTAIEHNGYSLENLQQTKSIIQNELSNRRSDVTLQIAIWTLRIMIIIFLADIFFNIPKIVEKWKWWFHTPKLDFHLKSYTPKRKTQYNLQPNINDEGMEEYTLRINNNPILGFEVRHTGRYISYNLKTIEIVAPKECDIRYHEVFAISGERPFIKSPYTDIWGNLKVFTDIKIVRGQISDPTIFGFILNYKFGRGEEKFITVKIRIDDCKNMFEKTFKIIGK